MKKTVKGVCLLLAVFLISSSLAACSFFEKPSERTASNNTPEAPQAIETPAAENPDAITDEAWNALVGHYVELEKNYARVKKAYDNSLVADNPDMASMLERAEEIIETMGETKHSQLTNADAADLEDVIGTLNESMNDLYHTLAGENEEEVAEGEETIPEEETSEAEETPAREESPTEGEAEPAENAQKQ